MRPVFAALLLAWLTLGAAGADPTRNTLAGHFLVARDDWDTVRTDLAIVFDTPPGELWDRIRLLRGLDL
jgi:hypothetical protein